MRMGLISLALLATTMACGLLSGTSGDSVEQGTLVPQAGETATERRNPFEAPMTNTPDADALAETVNITGTISAVVDGEPMTWQTGTVTAEGQTGSLAQWEPFAVASTGDIYFVSIIGLPPHESLELDGAAALGTRIELEFIIRAPSAGQEISYEVTAGEPATFEGADVFYFAEGEAGTDMYELVDGRALLSIEAATPGEPAAFSGRFSGTLAFADPLAGAGQPDMTRAIQLTEGQFEVSSVAFNDGTDGGGQP